VVWRAQDVGFAICHSQFIANAAAAQHSRAHKDFDLGDGERVPVGQHTPGGLAPKPQARRQRERFAQVGAVAVEAVTIVADDEVVAAAERGAVTHTVVHIVAGA
jgi:hypothetical protein